MALKIGISSCLLGNKCNFDGNDLLSAFVKKLSENSQIQVVPFCPEDSIFEQTHKFECGICHTYGR